MCYRFKKKFVIIKYIINLNRSSQKIIYICSFGCGVAGKRTGIIFNNGLDDFSYPNVRQNFFGLPSSKPNFLQPGKRAMSSMSPTIITDTRGNVKLVIGSAGGTKITTAVAMVIMRVLWFDQDIKQAIDAPRIHHQLVPNEIEYEFGNLQVCFCINFINY